MFAEAFAKFTELLMSKGAVSVARAEAAGHRASLHITHTCCMCAEWRCKIQSLTRMRLGTTQIVMKKYVSGVFGVARCSAESRRSLQVV